VKSLVGACIFTLYFFIFYYLALPLHLHCPALPCFKFTFCYHGTQEEKVTQGTGNVFFFPFAAKDRKRKLHKERAVFFFSFCCQGQEEKITQGTDNVFFLLLPGTRGKNYTGNGQCFFFFCCQGQEEEVTHGLFFFFPVGGSALLDSVTIGGGVRFDGSLVAGMDETSVRLDDGSGERSQGLLHLLPQKYTGAESGVASPKAFIYKKIMP